MAGLKITPLKHDGLDAIELLHADFRLVIQTSRGPRIAFFGRPGGANLLYWAPGKHLRGAWELVGGHRVWWTRPGADEAEETYAPDNAACTVETHGDGVTVSGALDSVHKVRRSLSIRLLASGVLQLDQSIRNESDMLWSGGLWGLTCTVPGAGTSYIVPLGDGTSWDYATMVTFRTWGGGHGGVGFADPQFEMTKDAVLLRPSGRENKRMIKADAGVIAMHDPSRGVLFAKRSVYQDGANYPLGTNLALYVGPQNFMVEMETMAPVVTLKPDQVSTHTEFWSLTAAPASAPDNATLKKLFS